MKNTAWRWSCAWAEPKLRVLAGPGRIQLDQVLDENENSLIPPPSAETNDASTGGEFRIRLACPESAGRKIARFRATDRCLIQRASEHLELPAPTTPVTRTVEGMSVLVKLEEDRDNAYTISLTVCAASATRWTGRTCAR